MGTDALVFCFSQVPVDSRQSLGVTFGAMSSDARTFSVRNTRLFHGQCSRDRFSSTIYLIGNIGHEFRAIVLNLLLAVAMVHIILLVSVHTIECVHHRLFVFECASMYSIVTVFFSSSSKVLSSRIARRRMHNTR